jgi:hypothetical protein
MRIPFAKLFVTSPFDGLLEHALKVKECAWAFEQATECFVAEQCLNFEEFRKQVHALENEADAIKRRIRGHLPKGTLLPVEKFQLFRYLREQDHVLDSVKDTLEWLSFRPQPGIPSGMQKNFMLLIDAVIDPLEDLSVMVEQAKIYFETFSEAQRVKVKEIIRKLRQKEHEADKLEDLLNREIFSTITDGVTVFHLVMLVEKIGSIADHAENAGDMMRAMIAK